MVVLSTMPEIKSTICLHMSLKKMGEITYIHFLGEKRTFLKLHTQFLQHDILRAI